MRTFPPQIVYGTPSAAGGGLLSQGGTYVTIYRDPAGATVEANLKLANGTAVPDGRVLIDATSRTPRLRLEDNVLVQPLYAKPDGSSLLTPVYADSEEVVAQISAQLALRASYGLNIPFGGTNWGFLGDSITNGSSSSNAASSSFRAVTQKIVGTARMLAAQNAGIPSDNAAQALARTDALIASGVNGIYLQIGTNDAGTGRTLAAFSADVQSIVRKARAANIPIVVGTVPPRAAGASAALKSLIVTYNQWLTAWGGANGVPIADTYSALVDSATGFMLAAYVADDSHPNDAGHLAMAKAIAPLLADIIPNMPWIAQTLSGENLVGSVPWSDGGGTAPASFDTEPASVFFPLPFGSWSTMTLTGSGFHVLTKTIDTSGYTSGERLRAALFVAGDRSPLSAGEGYPTVQIANAGTPTSVVDPASVSRPGPIFLDFVAPASTGLTLRVVGSTTAGITRTARVGAAGVFNLTRLGL